MTPTVRRCWPFGWVREIPREAGRYLTRWSLREQKATGGGGWRVYLHRFWANDTELHNHPWHWSFSLILTGSYTERYFDSSQLIDLVHIDGARGGIEKVPAGGFRTRRVRWFNWIPASRFHQITELHGTVRTLFFSGPLHRKSWGFWVPGRGLVPHRARKVERGLPES